MKDILLVFACLGPLIISLADWFHRKDRVIPMEPGPAWIRLLETVIYGVIIGVVYFALT